jgi:hypothetical protein
MRFLITFFTFLLSVSFYGQNDYSMSFDGVDDYVDFGNINIGNINNATFEFWIKTIETSGYNLLLNQDCDGCEFSTGDWGFVSSNGVAGRIDFSINNSNGDAYVTGDVINDDIWHFISVTRNSQTGLIKLYIDADLINSHLGPTGLVSNNSNLQFGLQQLYNPAYYEGLAESVEIWDKVLTQQEIQNYMNCPPSGDEEGLVGYWNFDEWSYLEYGCSRTKLSKWLYGFHSK